MLADSVEHASRGRETGYLYTYFPQCFSGGYSQGHEVPDTSSLQGEAQMPPVENCGPVLEQLVPKGYRQCIYSIRDNMGTSLSTFPPLAFCPTAPKGVECKQNQILRFDNGWNYSLRFLLLHLCSFVHFLFL